MYAAEEYDVVNGDGEPVAKAWLVQGDYVVSLGLTESEARQKAAELNAASAGHGSGR